VFLCWLGAFALWLLHLCGAGDAKVLMIELALWPSMAFVVTLSVTVAVLGTAVSVARYHGVMPLLRSLQVAAPGSWAGSGPPRPSCSSMARRRRSCTRRALSFTWRCSMRLDLSYGEARVDSLVRDGWAVAAAMMSAVLAIGIALAFLESQWGAISGRAGMLAQAFDKNRVPGRLRAGRRGGDALDEHVAKRAGRGDGRLRARDWSRPSGRSAR